MKKRILMGIDAPLSLATQHALRILSELLEDASSQTTLVLLHVIPLPTMTSSPTLGINSGHIHSSMLSAEQRERGEVALRRARMELQNRGLAPGQIEMMMRVGIPAEEMAKMAKELQVDMLVVGNRGYTLRQRVRRFFTGSMSRRALMLAPCPVTIIALPTPVRIKHPHDLVAWYKQAISRYLQERTGDLTILTPQEVALAFAPPGKNEPGRKEHAAAILALEQLAQAGVLYRRDVKGEMRYVND